MHTGRDLGLREGGWDFAITNDWADTEFYRAYDTDPEHNRLRHDMIAPICAHIARTQISTPPEPTPHLSHHLASPPGDPRTITATNSGKASHRALPYGGRTAPAGPPAAVRGWCGGYRHAR